MSEEAYVAPPKQEEEGGAVGGGLIGRKGEIVKKDADTIFRQSPE